MRARQSTATWFEKGYPIVGGMPFLAGWFPNKALLGQACARMLNRVVSGQKRLPDLRNQPVVPPKLVFPDYA